MKYKINLRLVFTNSLITKELLSDPVGNAVLGLLPQGAGINIHSERLKKYIEEKYPNQFSFNWSATKLLRDVCAINIYSKENIVVPSFLDVNNNHEILERLEHKENIELIVDEICVPNCPNYYQHYKEFSKEILLDPSAKTNICSCIQSHSYYDRRTKKPHNISPEDIEVYYEPLGFKSFKITGREDYDTQIIESYVRYLIKPEWKDYIRNELIEKVIYF